MGDRVLTGRFLWGPSVSAMGDRFRVRYAVQVLGIRHFPWLYVAIRFAHGSDGSPLAVLKMMWRHEVSMGRSEGPARMERQGAVRLLATEDVDHATSVLLFERSASFCRTMNGMHCREANPESYGADALTAAQHRAKTDDQFPWWFRHGHMSDKEKTKASCPTFTLDRRQLRPRWPPCGPTSRSSPGRFSPAWESRSACGP